MTDVLQRVTYLVVGPEQHGVVRHGLATAAELMGAGAGSGDGASAGTGATPRVPAVELQHLPDADDLAAPRAVDPRTPVHLDVTDALFGDTPREAVALLTSHLDGRRTTLTLHDVPQPAEGAVRYAGRAAAYADLAHWAAGVVVSSEHERALLQQILAQHRLSAATPEQTGPIAVVPLPVPDRRHPDAILRARTDPAGWAAQLPDELAGLEQDVVVLGFLYPGKGHAEALQALAEVRASSAPDSPDSPPVRLPTRVTALGPVAAGHEDLVDRLRDQAEGLGLSFRATGFVADRHLEAALLAAGIPVAAHRNVSASGSLASWMSVGRRAIVPAGTYTAEMERLRPGTLALQSVVDPTAALATGIRTALSNPVLTWIDPDLTLSPTPADGATALLRFLTEAHR